MTQLDSFEAIPGRLKALEAKHTPSPALYAPVILLYEVVEVFVLGERLINPTYTSTLKT